MTKKTNLQMAQKSERYEIIITTAKSIKRNFMETVIVRSSKAF
jgi:hypothetical protein